MPNDNDVVFKIEESIKDDIKYQDLLIKNKELFDIKKVQNWWFCQHFNFIINFFLYYIII